MRNTLKLFTACLFVIGSGCSYPEQETTVFSISFSFNENSHGWTGDFADYPETDSITYGLYFSHDLLPDNLNATGSTFGMHLSGNNGNSDLFMFIKKKITGLRPNKTYELLFSVKVASNTPEATGQLVYLKAGASVVEPKKELQAGVYRMNIDKGNKAESGSAMINIGNIGVSGSAYSILTRTNSSKNSFTVTTDNLGELWLIVGTDSGLNGLTELYYTQVDVTFNQLD